MAFQFTQSEQIKSLQAGLYQNNDLYKGKQQLLINMNLYYDGLALDTPEQKEARWKRTPKYLYYPKIVGSFTSSIYKKPPQYVLNIDQKYIDNVDLLGNNVDEYSSQIPTQVLKQGFSATIIDWSDKLKRPYFIFIQPEQFVSFFVKYDNGVPQLAQFIYTVMEEEQDPSDEFNLVLKKVHYVWDIVQIDDGLGGVKDQVRVRKYVRVQTKPDESVFDRMKDKTEYEDALQEETLLVANGEPLSVIPIIIHGKETNNFSVEKSVLQDVSDLNIDLINRVVDQIEVLHLTAMPTPYITGADANDPDIPTTIGCSKLWVLGDPDAKVGLLEFTGKAADAHREYIEELKDVMATSGAQILKQQGVSRETATSVLIRTDQETAIITNIVVNISSQMTDALKIYTKWLGKDNSKVEYHLNSDFVSVTMEPNAQIALVRSWLDGALSHKSMFKKMKEGELIASDKSFEEEMIDIKANPPTFPLQTKQAELDIKTNAANAAVTAKATATAQGQTNTNPNNNQSAIPKLKGSNLDTGTKAGKTKLKE